jgi:hypothetical protein
VVPLRGGPGDASAGRGAGAFLRDTRPELRDSVGIRPRSEARSATVGTRSGASPARPRPWRWLLAVPGLVLALVVSTSGAPAAAAERSAQSGPHISVGITSLYSVRLAQGNWWPLVVSVTDGGSADLSGQLVVTAPVSQVAAFSVPNCYTDGTSTFCTNSASFSLQPSKGFASSLRTLTEMTYNFPLDVAPATTKRMELYILADSPQGVVRAEVLDGAGKSLARAATRLPVSYSNSQPVVLVVSDGTGTFPSLPISLPVGPGVQSQRLSAPELPGSAAALGAFSAIDIEQADTTELSLGQRQALVGYVKAGGTLVLTGGLDWQGTLDGLPDGLVPATVEGTTALNVPQLAHLVGAPPVGGTVTADILKVRAGSVPIVNEGALPLAVEASRGLGTVVLSAVDPAAPPLSTWAGNRWLVARLFAPAFQIDYSSAAGSFVSGTGPVEATPNSVPASIMGDLGVGDDFDPMSPIIASGALHGYIEELPSTAPSGPLLALILLGYVLLTGPVCYMALARLRRRDLAWVVVPSLALVGWLLTFTTGTGINRGPSVEEIRIAQFAPGDEFAQVTTLGRVYVGPSGARQLTFTSPGLVSDLAVADGAELVVSPGEFLGKSVLTVVGRNNSIDGWAASEDNSLPGTLAADVRSSAGTMFGHVTNYLRVKLTDAYLVTASGAVRDLGTLLPGASAGFRLSLAPDNAVTPGGYPMSVGFPATISTPSISIPVRPGSRSAWHQAALQGLYDLAALYSARSGGAPVLVAFSSRELLPSDTGGEVTARSVTDTIVVPLLPAQPPAGALTGLTPQVVGSSGVTGVLIDGLGTDSFILGKGGYVDYQFLLTRSVPHAQLTVDLGSPSGQGPGAVGGLKSGLGAATLAPRVPRPAAARVSDVSLSVFDIRSGSWRPLRVIVHQGQLVAEVPEAGQYLKTAGALQLRLSASTTGVEVFGQVPTLSASSFVRP